MVRRVFGRLLANNIVSVQPLNLPTGLLFYMDHQVGIDDDRSNTNFKTVYDAHYDNQGYGYSRGAETSYQVNVGETAMEAGDGFTTAGANTAIASAAASREIDVPYFGKEVGLTSAVLVVTDETSGAGDGDAPEGTPVDFSISRQNWLDDIWGSNGEKTPANSLLITVAPRATDGQEFAGVGFTWKEYADLEANANMAEVKMVVTSTTVQVTSRKMKAHWTPELSQDLAAYHSINAEAELTGLLSEELAGEIDREILADLCKYAAFTDQWNYDRTATTTRLDGSTVGPEPAAAYLTQKEYNQTLITKVNKVSAAIHKSTLRGGANWIVCSTEIGSVLEDMDKFRATNQADDTQFNVGIEQIGTVGSRYTVYKDPWMPMDYCLIGHKGTSFMDTGYVYAPYIPFQLTPTILDPDDFTPRKGIMTRYAKKMVNNRYYGLIRVIFPTDYNVIGVPSPYAP